MTGWTRPESPHYGIEERELLLGFLHTKRCHIVAATEGLTEEQARWTPDGRLIPLIGIINHVTCVEWRWIDGRYLREPVSRSEEEFAVGGDRTLDDVLAAYWDRAHKTAAVVRAAPGLDAPCLGSPGQPPRPGLDLRWVLLHLIEETAHHAGHADSTREMLDGSKAGR